MAVPSDQELYSIFAAIRNQEETFYITKDYLDQDFQAQQIETEDGYTYSGISSTASSSSTRINHLWREKICEWSYQVVDHFNFSREVVAIATNYLDRYLAVRTVNRKTFQLVAMTCLFMSIKLNESRTLRLSTFLELSRGYFEAEHVIETEREICCALEWHMHPPTPILIAKYLGLLIPKSVYNIDEVIEIARFLTEISVCDYGSFITKKPSSIAIAAVLCGMELVGCKKVSEEQFSNFHNRVSSVAGLHFNDPQVQECRAIMHEAFAQGGFSSSAFRTDDNKDHFHNGSDSPTCVN